MKAISIRQPWAHFIWLEEKHYEYRSWSTDHRGDLLVCVSANPKIEGAVSGCALCLVKITDVIRVTRKNYIDLELDEPPARGEMLYAWKMEDVRTIKPFPVKGKLHLYDVDDTLIECEPDSYETDEEAEAWFNTYIAPYVYRKNQE